MDFTQLDDLLNVTKKSDAPKEKKKLFFEKFLSLLSEEGFNANTEKYFFNGFLFCGSSPIFEYMKKLDPVDKMEVLKSVFKSTNYEENEKSVSLKILVHFLSLFIVYSPENTDIIVEIIRRIPYKTKTRANTITKDLPLILDKYFIFEITSDTIFPDYRNLVGDKNFGVEFSDIFINGLKELKAKNDEMHKKILKVIKWLDRKAVEDNSFIAKLQNANSIQKDEQQPKAEFNIDSLIRLKDSLQNNVSTLTKALFFISDLQNELSFAKRDKKKIENDYSMLKTEYEKLNSEKSRLLNDCYNLKNKNTLMEEAITHLKNETEQQKSVLSIYSSDKQNSLTEQLNIIASQLKTHYLNFKDSLEMEMTVELGENIKHLVEDIFKTLAKSGIDVRRKV